MTAVENELHVMFKKLSQKWASIMALGTFSLYLSGYLALRFHLTVFGIGTDLSVIDERYLFAGAKCLVFIVSVVPSMILILLFLSLILYPIWRIPYIQRRLRKIGEWWTAPFRLSLTGIILSVALIQLVMRQCFLFENLLLADRIPEPGWMRAILLNQGGTLLTLYFAGLISGTGINSLICFLCWRSAYHTRLSFLMARLLLFLVGVQILFLPVNYGVIVLSKTAARVSDIGGQIVRKAEQDAWIVWEGGHGVTYLIRNTSKKNSERKLVTLFRKDLKKIEITGYDPILRVLFTQTAGDGRKQ